MHAIREARGVVDQERGACYMIWIITFALAVRTATTPAMTSGRRNSVVVHCSRTVHEPPSTGVRVVGLAQVDTGRPRLPTSRALPDDSTRTLASPFGTVERYYRDIVGVMFDDTASGRTIWAILTKYRAVIVAGGEAFPHPVYYLQVPDPGGTYAGIDSLARAIQAETGVFSTSIPQWRSRLKLRSRRPKGGPP